METNYLEWIKGWLAKNDPYGACDKATLEMQKTFPELIRVRGHYHCCIWGEREHWWLVDKDGNIVDPTVAQFPSNGLGEYVPWDESQPEPTGICPNCGGFCYNAGDVVCSEKCHDQYRAYILGS